MKPQNQSSINSNYAAFQLIFPNPAFVEKINTEFFIGCETISIKKSKESKLELAIDFKSRLPIVGL